MMRLTFLGTGTSTGVPQIGCHCAACRSVDPADKRMRASAILEAGDSRLLIDCGPDLRTQLLTVGSPCIDAMLVTHSHYDHVGGLIDLRAYALDHHFPVYCQANVASDLRTFFPYCFVDDLYPGVPTFKLNHVQPYKPFTAAGIEVTPLPVMHYKLEILGFRFGPLAYITDCKTMPEETLQALKGVDTLVLNALRHEPHMSHLSLEESIGIARRVGARCTVFTHMSHDMGPVSLVRLPQGMEFAHDFQTLEVEE